jgi:hypothetical protein
MWIVAAAVVLIVLVVVVRLASRHPKGDDLTSVRSYHTALGTLEQLSDRTSRSSIKVVSPRDETGDTYVRPRPASDRSGPGAPIPPLPVRGNEEFPDPETPLIFDDARPRERAPREATGTGGPSFRTPRAQRQALDSMNHRPRRVMSVLIVVAALVLFGVLAYVGSHRSNSGKTTKAAGGTTSSTGGSHPTTTTPSHLTTTTAAKSATTTTTKPAKKTKPVPTTLPTQVVATASTTSSATYPVPGSSASYQVTVTATGTIWVSATTMATGATLWAGKLEAGAVQNIQATGAIEVQLGTPTATIALNQIPVVFPTPLRSPFVATFQPTTTSAATPTTTAPSSTATSTAAP